MKTQLVMQCSQLCRVSMPQSWHMDKLEQAKHSQWRASNTIAMTHNVVSFQEQLKKYSDTSQVEPMSQQHSWCESVICKYTMK